MSEAKEEYVRVFEVCYVSIKRGVYVGGFFEWEEEEEICLGSF